MQSFYIYPGPYEIGNYADGIGFECDCRHEDEIESMLNEGWSLTPDDALAASTPHVDEWDEMKAKEFSELLTPEAIKELKKPRGRPSKAAHNDQKAISS